MLPKHLIDKLYNEELREDSIFGAVRCVITGEQDDENPQYIEVKLPHERIQLARMSYTFPLVAVPSKEWLQKYKDSIYAWVVFERGLPERPIVIGFTFNEDSEHNVDSYPRSATIIGEKFVINIDDKNDRLELKQLEDAKQEIVMTKDKVYVKSDDINLGEESGAEPSVLGDTLEGLLNDFIDAVMQGKVPTSMGPMTFMPDTLTKLGQIKAKMSTIKSKINKLS